MSDSVDGGGRNGREVDAVQTAGLSEDVQRLVDLLRKQQSNPETPLHQGKIQQMLRVLESGLFQNIHDAYEEVAKTVQCSKDEMADADEVAQKTIAVYNASQGILQPRCVDIPKVPAGLGFNIMGGNDIGVPIYISKILPGGITEKTGGLRRGDQLLAVNGEAVISKSHDDVVKLLKSADGTVRLIVHYSPELLDQMESEFENSRRKSARRGERPSTSSK